MLIYTLHKVKKKYSVQESQKFQSSGTSSTYRIQHCHHPQVTKVFSYLQNGLKEKKLLQM